MKNTNRQMVTDFMEKLGWHARRVPTPPHQLDQHERYWRAYMVLEEALELIEAMGFIVVVNDNGEPEMATEPAYDGDIVAVADGLADLEYVLLGLATACGMPQEDLFREVHRSNMTKFGKDGNTVTYHPNGKLAKGADYEPPDIEGVLREAGWQKS